MNRSASAPYAGMPSGKLLLRPLAHERRGLGPPQAGRPLLEQRLERDAVDQVHRVDDVALGLRHLLAVVIAHDAVDVDVAERHPAGEVGRHHDHPRDPEEDDLVAGDQHRGREIELVGFPVVAFGLGPAERGVADERRGEPGVEDVRVAPERPGEPRGARLRGRRRLVAGDVDPARVVVPRRDLVAPPELARDAPVLDVREPLVVGVDPVLGKELHLAFGHHVERDPADRPAGEERAFGRRLRHCDEPLVGEHRLDDRAGAAAARHRHPVRLDRLEEPERLQVLDDALAGVVAIEPSILRRRVLVDLRVEREDPDLRQAVPLSDLVVVEVVRRRDLQAPGAELLVDVGVADDRDLAFGERQHDALADQMPVALVLGVHRDRDVAEHRLGPGRRDRQAAQAADRPPGEGVA